MKNFWKDKRVLVTGGTGFIGSFVSELLLQNGAHVSVTTRSQNPVHIEDIKRDIEIIKTDLRSYNETVKITKKKDIVLHLAARVAGIQYNIDHPATMFMDTIQMGKNIIEASRVNNIERLLMTSSACVYRRYATIPTPESEGFVDDPEETNLGYGWSKRVLELMARFYYMEYKMKIAIARPYNAYGPRDNFDPQTSHVIPGLIRRVLQEENPLTVWGSGKQTRSFLYVKDLAEGLLTITEKYPNAEPINIGTDEEISIADLAKLIVQLSGKDINIEFDSSKPDGQPRRNCDTTKAKKLLHFEANTSLSKGLKETILWYKQHLLS